MKSTNGHAGHVSQQGRQGSFHGHVASTSASRPNDRSPSSRYWRDVLHSEDAPHAGLKSSSHASASSSTSVPSTLQIKNGTNQSSSKSKNLRSPSTRQFLCELCQHRFERRGHLDSHIETVHEGKRPHRCPRGCGKVFGHRSSLQRHVKQVHENPHHRDFDKSPPKTYDLSGTGSH